MRNPIIPFFKIFGCLILLSACSENKTNAQNVALIPAPVQIQTGSGNFQITKNTVIGIPAKQLEVFKVASYLIEALKPATGYTLKIVESGNAEIKLLLNVKPDARLAKEGYTLHST